MRAKVLLPLLFSVIIAGFSLYFAAHEHTLVAIILMVGSVSLAFLGGVLATWLGAIEKPPPPPENISEFPPLDASKG